MENRKHLNIRDIRLALESLSVFRNLLKDSVIAKLLTLVSTLDGNRGVSLGEAIGLFNDLYFGLASNSPLTSLKSYIIYRLVYDENPFSHMAEKSGLPGVDPVLARAASNDLSSLQLVCELEARHIGNHLIYAYSAEGFEAQLIRNLPSWDFAPGDRLSRSPDHINQIVGTFESSHDWASNLADLTGFYSTYGCGMFARYRAFVWESGEAGGYLRGIDEHDPIRLGDLIGYDEERSEVVNNTLQFLNGFSANNVLLYGDRGTGKSSTVKGILNEYHTKGLRMIEVPKKHLIDFAMIISLLRDRRHKFIIFVDDLAFEDNEENYTALKAVLEGGLESKPSNVVIYATSNRRHLIKEKFSDRAGLQYGNHDDEVRAADTMQEKLSLADRFGITVVFSSPDKNRYLRIVEGIAEKRGLKLDRDYIHKEALKWELWYNGRSPRTARQFVDWLEGTISKQS